MFSYINVYGKYPPGLFSSFCQGDKNGLPCEAEVPSPSSSENVNASRAHRVLQSFSVFIWIVLVNLLGNLVLTS
nr:unknown [Picea sitchensis]